jgi:Protein of unknown function (DUF1549)/Protein of unknown function (DUF1553)
MRLFRILAFGLAASGLFAADDDSSVGAAVPAWRRLSLAAPPLPDSGRTHPVDKLLGAHLRENSAIPPRRVSDALFARRVYLDLWGLLPTPEQLEAFERDPAPGKRAALVDSLLANSALYAHHWMSFWNDHLRNDEGVVYHGERKSITEWLQPALEKNLPYDKFVQALLNPEERKGPEGFLIGVNWRGDVNSSQSPVMQAAQNTAQVFLGVNLKCNSCHDSFISRWKLKDAYGLASFFAPVPLEIHRCDTPANQIADTKFLYPELGNVDTFAPLAVKLEVAAKLFTMPENGRTPRVLVNRFWKVLFGRAITEPVDDLDARPFSPELLDWLAADFVANGYDMKQLLRRIMTSDAYAMESWSGPAAAPYVFHGPEPRRLSGEQFSEAVSAITGEWRLLEPRRAENAKYAREWQLKSTPLERSLGRPIRDQVFTERVTAPTTLQALELVNGSTLAGVLQRGALRMLGKLPGAAAPLFDSGVVNSRTKEPIPAKVDVRGLSRIWLVVQNLDTYDPARTKAFWADTNLPGGRKQLPAPVPSTQVIELRPGTKHFEAKVGIDQSSRASDISPSIRFFVFGEEPDPKQYLAVDGEPPVTRAAPFQEDGVLIERVYRHGLGRAPRPAERVAARAFNVTTPDGLEDFLWAIALSPEFQYVR